MRHRLKHCRNKQKSARRAIVGVSLVFHAIMLVLALGARRMHRASLPHVEVTVPVLETFWEGEEMSVSAALPEKLVDGRKVFVVSEEMVNGERRTIAREAEGLEFGRLSGNYREVVSGPNILSQVIVTDIELTDGQEVWIKGEWSDE